MNLKNVISFLWLTWSAHTLLLIFNPAMVHAADLPNSIIIDYLAELYQPVIFDHELHAKYAACTECHHHATGSSPSKRYCQPCHNTKKETMSVACHSCHPAETPVAQADPEDRTHPRYHIDIVGLKGAYHLNCIDCHEGIGTGPTACVGCHKMTEQAERFFHLNSATYLVTEQSKTPVEGEKP